MRPSDVQVKVDGRWLRSLGHVVKVTFSSRHEEGPCGPDLMSVEIVLDPRNDTGFLRIGRTLEVYDRGVLVWGGRISGPGRGTPRTIEAKGWPRVAWDAILSPTPGQRVGRDAANQPYTPTDALSPRWLLDASDLDVGIADDRLYTQVEATYVSALGSEGQEDVTNTVARDDLEAQALYGTLPFALDLTPLGLIEVGVAASYAEQQLREFAIPEWTSRVVTNSLRLRTLNGHAAHLPDVQAGQMVRMFGLPATYGGLRRQAATDVILGEVSYSTDSPDEITIAPARVAVRSIADAVRQMAEARRAQEKAA